MEYLLQNLDTDQHLSLIPATPRSENASYFFGNSAKVNVQDYAGRTPLHNAVKSTHLHPVAKYLLSQGADPRISDKHGCTPLHEAVSCVCMANIELLIACGCVVNVQDNEGKTPLYSAVIHDSCTAIPKYLLEHNADPCIATKEGFTPLHNAVLNGSKDNVDLLFSAGYDVNIQNCKKQTALHLATSDLILSTKVSFVSMFNHKDQLHLMLDIALALLMRSDDVNLTDIRGRTVLSELTSTILNTGWPSNDIKSLKLVHDFFNMFIKKNGNLNYKDEDFNTVLHLFGMNMMKVAEMGCSSLIVQFLENGADIAIHNKNGQSFLSLFSAYSRKANASVAVLGKIQEALQISSLQCLCIHAVYLLRDRVKPLPQVLKLVKQYLNILD